MQIRKSTTGSVRTGATTSRKPVSKLAKKRTQKTKQRFVFWSVFVFVLVVLYVLAMRSSFFSITDIQIRGADSEYFSGIKVDAENYIKKNTLFVLPHKNIFIFSPKDASDELLKKNSFLEKVTFERRGLHTLVVSLTPRKPIFSVQDPVAESSVIAYIDKTGRIFTDAYAVISTSTIQVKEKTQATGTSTTSNLPIDFVNKIGTTLDQEYISNLLFYVEQLQKKNFSVRKVEILPLEDVELYVTDSGGSIRVNLSDDREKVLATFSAAKKAEPLRTYITNNLQNLEYVDLRFGNKVFYKFKGVQ